MRPLPSLMVAPNGARKTKADHAALPIALDEIVATAVECHDAGADGLHLHVRDENGRHILDAGLYLEALAELRRGVPSMLLQITTEAVGLYSAAHQRYIVERVHPEAVSVALAEMVEGADPSEVVAFYDQCAQTDIAVQHILYGERDLSVMSGLLNSGSIQRDGLQLLFVLGRYSQNQQSAPEDLDPFVEWQKHYCPSSEWAVCAFGTRETECLTTAHHKGGKVRVGFENSLWNADGTDAASIAERVLGLRRFLV